MPYAAGRVAATSAAKSSSCGKPARLGERMFQKIVFQRQLADLGVQFRQVRITARGASGVSKYLNRTLCQLPLPVRNLVRVNVILLPAPTPLASCRSSVPPVPLAP